MCDFFPQSSQNLIRKAFLGHSSQNFKQSGGDKYVSRICTYIPKKKKKVDCYQFFLFLINEMEITLLFYIKKIITLFSALCFHGIIFFFFVAIFFSISEPIQMSVNLGSSPLQCMQPHVPHCVLPAPTECLCKGISPFLEVW